MSRFSDPSDFMCGIYAIEFGSDAEAGVFIERYAGCPVWPIITQGVRENEVIIVAVELNRQAHGDFSQERNTLVRNPGYLGAKAVRFKRDDSLLKLLGGYEMKTGYSDVIPCGSDCEECASYMNPCQGCPAHYEYEA
jgi:hypothetical protein